MNDVLRSSAAWLLALALVACNLGDDVDETTYRVGGVTVVIENDNGPEEAVMVLAAEIFRRAAFDHFSIDVDTDDVIWREIEEIRWKAGLIPPIGGNYDHESLKISLEYHGCIVDAPLFRLLAAHYNYQLTADPKLPEADVTWAEELSAANTILCAS